MSAADPRSLAVKITCCGRRGGHEPWCRSNEACAAVATPDYLASLDAERWDAPAKPPTIHTILVGALRHERSKTECLSRALNDVRSGFLARGDRLSAAEAVARRLRGEVDGADRARLVAEYQRDRAVADARGLREDLAAIASLLGLACDAAAPALLEAIRGRAAGSDLSP